MSLVITAIITLILLFFIPILVQLHRWRFVNKTSKALNQLTALNRDYSARLSPAYYSHYDIVVRYKRLEQYGDRSFEYAFGQYVAENINSYLSIYHSLQFCNRLYEEYSEKLIRIKNILGTSWHASFFLSESKYNALEKRAFYKAQLPPIKTKFRVTKSYTSRKKQRHYECSKVFYANEFIRECNKTFEKAQKRESANAERKKMTRELRYEVLRRDGFQCVLCGRRASDGIILHADHIIPVSKGGKTELENLRTLCADCNLGKGDKLEIVV